VTRPEAEIAELPTDPGARLRRQRELGGLTEQQVAERLNLDVVAVVALETSDYAALGAPVFVRGHLRRYAALLGLPADEILGAYDRSRVQLAPPTLVPRSREEMAPPRPRILSPWLVAGALALVAAAGIAAYVGEYGLHLPRAAGARDADVSQRSAHPAESNPAAGDARGPVPVAEGAAPAAQGAVAMVAAPAGQVALVFEFAADSWIEVYDGAGKTVLYDLGKAGTRRAVTGVAPLSVTLGNAPAVALTVDGRRVTVPSPPPGETVTRFGVGPDGSQR
jgi:cytoskeleton protein RodZ